MRSQQATFLAHFGEHSLWLPCFLYTYTPWRCCTLPCWMFCTFYFIFLISFCFDIGEKLKQGKDNPPIPLLRASFHPSE